MDGVWISPPVTGCVPQIFRKYEEAIKRDTNFETLFSQIKLHGILTYDQTNLLANKGQSALSDSVKIVKLLQYVSYHGERGWKVLIASLKASGESAHHTRLAKRLEWELIAIPNEREIKKQQERYLNEMNRSLLLSVTGDLRKQAESNEGTLRDLKAHVLLLPEDRSGRDYIKCKLKIPTIPNTDGVIQTLATYGLISYDNSPILVEIAQTFCCQSVRDQASQFETMRGFPELKRNVISELATIVPLYQLKFCMTCTPILCGASDYYRSIKDLHDTTSVIERISLWNNPRLFVRLVNLFSNQYLTEHKVREYALAVEDQRTFNPAEEELLQYQDEYASIVTELVCEADLHITDIIYSSHKNSGHLAVLPYFNYQYTAPLIHVLRAYVRHTTNVPDEVAYTVEKTSRKLEAYIDKWSRYSESTKVAKVSDALLNEYPIDYSREEKVVITLHMDGDEWKDPTLSQPAELAKLITQEYRVPPESITPIRPILTYNQRDGITHRQTDAKGHCKVEFVGSTKAACIIIRNLLSKLMFFRGQSITHAEFKAVCKYHFIQPVESFGLLQKQAFTSTHLSSHFQELHSATLPPTIPQQTTKLWCIVYMYSVYTSILLAVCTYYVLHEN